MNDTLKKLQGVYEFEIRGVDGKVRDSWKVNNAVMTVGFDSMFHEAIAYYMASQIATINVLKIAQERRQEWQEWLLRIRRHYAQKFRDMYPPRMRIRNDINDYI
jgi:hypothetical protein